MTYRRRIAGLAVMALGLGTMFVSTGPAGAAESPVGLGSALSYAVLASSTVTNTGSSVITGDVGVSPGTAVTGFFPPGVVVGGTIHAADAHAAAARAALVTAYSDAAGRTSTGVTGAELGGQTLTAGVYTGGAVGLTGTLTLNGQGDPDAVFIFQIASTLTTASASNILLIGSASACNVFWQIGSSATLGTNSQFVGTILAATSVTATTGASVEGRLLARDAAVTLDTNTVTASACAAAVTTTTSTTLPATTTSTTSATSPTSTTTVVPPVPTTTGTAEGGPVTPTTLLGGGGTPTTISGGSSVMLPRTGAGITRTGWAGALTVLCGLGLVAWSRRTLAGAR